MAASRMAIWALGIAMIVVLGGVGAYLMSGKPAGTGKVTIYVKDLPDDWAHINVTFSEVRIHQASAGNESGWHNLTFHDRVIDLASLVNVSELLAYGNVGPGKYTQIRIVVANVTGVMTNGTMVNFKVPSGELKTTHPFNITAGSTTVLTLDIDLAHSIVHNGSGWIFKPVLGSISES